MSSIKSASIPFVNSVQAGLIGLTCFFLPISASLKSITLSLTLGLALLIPSIRRDAFLLFKTPWGKALSAYFVYLCLATTWSDASTHACFDAIEKNTKLLYLPFLTVFFFNQSNRLLGLKALLGGVSLVAILSLASYFDCLSFLHINPDHVFKNHIIMGYMGACGLYIAAYLGLNCSGFKRLGYLMLSLICGFQVIWINAGRMGYVLTLFLLACLLWQARVFRVNKWVIAIIVLSLTAFYVLSPVRQERMDKMVQEWHEFNDVSKKEQTTKNTSIGYRLQFHTVAKDLFLSHPFVGNGTASYGEYVAKHHLFQSWTEGPLKEPHSQYWLVAAEQGLIGLGLLATFFITLWLALRRSPRYGFFGIAMMMAFILNQLTDSMLYYSPGFFFVMLMAIFLGEIYENSV